MEALSLPLWKLVPVPSTPAIKDMKWWREMPQGYVKRRKWNRGRSKQCGAGAIQNVVGCDSSVVK